MKKYRTDQIRNIGLFGHGGAGKTTLAEAMLFNTGVIDRLGRVDEGNTVTDFDPDEIKRKLSIYTALAPCEWKQHKINVLDTPGFMDFVAEVKSATRVVDGALMVVSASAGVEVGLERVWQYAEDANLPRVVFVNRMDKENADFFKVLQEMRERLSSACTAVQIPIGAFESFRGVVDLVLPCAFVFENGKAKKTEIPEDSQKIVSELRENLLEAVAETDDSLLEKYLEGQELSGEEFHKALRCGIRDGKIIPVLCGSAYKNIGVSTLQDAIVEFLPSPADRGDSVGADPRTAQECKRLPDPSASFSALVFKTMADPYVGKLTMMRIFSGTLRPDSVVHNPNRGRDEKVGTLFIMRGKHQEPIDEATSGEIVTVAKLQETATGDALCDRENPIKYPPIDFPAPVMSMAISPKSKGDEDKMSAGLSRLTDEDPTLVVQRNTETKETIISGMGELHLEISVDRLKRKFGSDVNLSTPKIPYKETIRGAARVQGRYKKQSGGRGQYGDCWIKAEPLERGGNFEFIDKIVGGVIPRNYIPAVEKGVRKAMEEGVIAGYPLVDIRVTLDDGSYHTVDSSDIAFQIAGAMALRKAAMEASPVLLEPIMDVVVQVPEQFMGDVIGDLNGKRGRIMGMEPGPRGTQEIRAQVPLAEMQRYSIDLRSITQGKGTFTMTFSHYEEVPSQIAESIIAASKKE